LAGLILGSDDNIAIGGVLPALFRVAGQSLIEYQVRVARAAGAGHIVVLVDQMPAALVAAFDRLRADGIDIDIARDARDAADRIHPDEMLLVMASGAVASQSLVSALAAGNQSALLTVADSPENVHCERIDAQSRWSGLALLEGKLLRATAALLGDWTLGPTLLRTAVQGGAERRLIAPGEQAALLGSESAALAFSHALAKGGAARGGGWFEGYVVNPIARFATPALIERNMPLELMLTLPLVLLGSSALLALMGLFVLGFFTLLLATIPAAIATIMAGIGSRDAQLLGWFERLKRPLLCLMLLLLGWSLTGAGVNWTALIAAAWVVSQLVLLEQDRAPWHISSETAALVMLMATAIGLPLIGLSLLVIHGLSTHFSQRYMR
jgi:hypothetical protein